MVEVKFYDNVADEFLKFAVIISKTDNKWVFCKHKERETYEIPGGHREPGESIHAISNIKNINLSILRYHQCLLYPPKYWLHY